MTQTEPRTVSGRGLAAFLRGLLPETTQFDKQITNIEAEAALPVPAPPPSVGDLIFASHVVTDPAESLPSGWTRVALPAPDALRAKLIDLAAPLYTSRKRAVEGVARWLNLEAAARAALREGETR